MRYLLSLLCLSCFVSCSKDDKKSEPSKTDLITASVWVFDKGGLDTNKDGTAELPFSFFGIQPCLLDNKGTFKSDGSGINDEGATKCDAALPQSTPFNWSFANNETALNITGSGFFGLSGQFKILALTDAVMTLSKDTTVPTFGSAAIVATLKH